jgi:hypothetical protein
MSAPFEIRPATNDDCDAIAAGFAQACGKPLAAVLEKVRWAFASNPSGWSGVVATVAGSRMAAHFGVSHVPMVLHGDPVVFGRVYAPWVEPGLRVAGVHGAFFEMSGIFRELFEGTSIAATFGVFADADWWTLRRLTEFEPVRTELLLVRRPGPHRAHAGAIEIARVTPEALAEWTAPLALGACHARRDGGTVGFRLGGPYRGDAAWMAVREGRPAGLVAVRDAGDVRTILDLSVPEGDEEAAHALLDAAIGDGSREIRVPWFTRSPWFLLAQRKGFRAVASDLPYVGIRSPRARLQASWLMQHWDAGAADLGLRAPPRMLASEETVTTAPPGTLTARDRIS